MTRTTLLAGATALALGLGAVSTPASADEFPERPIRVIVPFAPGALTDTVARLFQRHIETHELLPQSIAVINVPGAGATVGSRQVMDSDPDGHTVLLLHLALLSAEALGMVDYGLDAFEPVAQTGSTCMILTAHERTPYHTLDDLLEHARANPDSVLEAVNLGAVVHIASLILTGEADVSFRYVQTGGGAERVQSMVGGHTEISLFSTAEFKSFEPLGIRPLAILQDERHPDFPDMPTAKEQGLDVTFCMDNWWFVPAGTPQDRIDVLADVFEQAITDPELQAAYAGHSLDPTYRRGEDLRAHIEAVRADIEDAAARAQ